MAPRTRNDKDFDEQRRRIAEAAAAVFAESGFQGATNRRIAEAAGISPGLIYWYFENKEELFAAAFEHLTPTQAINIPPEIADSVPVEQFLTAVAQRGLANAARPEFQQVIRMVLSEAIRFPDASQRFHSVMVQEAKGLLVNYIERRIADGTFREVDPPLAAQAFIGSLMGYVVRKHVLLHEDLAQVNDEEMAATISRIYLNGLMADKPAEME